MFQKILAWFKKRKQQAMFESEDFDLKEWLDHEIKIGDTSDDVADFLKGQKIVAQRRNVFACPIATWLRMVTPDLPGYETLVCVSSATYSVTYEKQNETTKAMENITRAHGTLPEAVAEFVYQFDYQYKYPELAIPEKPYVRTPEAWIVATDNLS